VVGEISEVSENDSIKTESPTVKKMNREGGEKYGGGKPLTSLTLLTSNGKIFQRNQWGKIFEPVSGQSGDPTEDRRSVSEVSEI
jgi:hypothetical protein